MGRFLKSRFKKAVFSTAFFLDNYCALKNFSKYAFGY